MLSLCKDRLLLKVSIFISYWSYSCYMSLYLWVTCTNKRPFTGSFWYPLLTDLNAFINKPVYTITVILLVFNGNVVSIPFRWWNHCLSIYTESSYLRWCFFNFSELRFPGIIHLWLQTSVKTSNTEELYRVLWQGKIVLCIRLMPYLHNLVDYRKHMKKVCTESFFLSCVCCRVSFFWIEIYFVSLIWFSSAPIYHFGNQLVECSLRV